MAEALKFEKKDECTFVAFLGETKAVRAIKESDGWRIDHTSAVAGTWMPWEPIDETSYPNPAAAREAIERWAR